MGLIHLLQQLFKFIQHLFPDSFCIRPLRIQLVQNQLAICLHLRTDSLGILFQQLDDGISELVIVFLQLLNKAVGLLNGENLFDLACTVDDRLICNKVL